MRSVRLATNAFFGSPWGSPFFFAGAAYAAAAHHHECNAKMWRESIK
jgi:hypothetical protein